MRGCTPQKLFRITVFRSWKIAAQTKSAQPVAQLADLFCKKIQRPEMERMCLGRWGDVGDESKEQRRSWGEQRWDEDVQYDVACFVYYGL